MSKKVANQPILDSVSHETSRDSLSILVHICCSVDSHHFLSELKKLFPLATLVGYFYNPNIHPEEEYQLRLLDVRRSCKLLEISLIEEIYDCRSWLEDSQGLENEPEKGKRCTFCFDFRLTRSVKKALELGLSAFTTTLLASPMKTQMELFSQGESLASLYHLPFIALDTRSRGGTQKQQVLAKEAHLYRQNYCGCLYALEVQRTRAHKNSLELLCALSPTRHAEEGLIQRRILAFKKRDSLEAEGRSYYLCKEKMLLWQNLYTHFADSQGNRIPAHLLSFSSLNKNLSVSVEHEDKDLAFLNKEGIVAITLSLFNSLVGRNYPTICSLVLDPPSTSEELNAREKLDLGNISPILVVESLPVSCETYRVHIKTLLQEEMVEKVLAT